MLSKLKFFSLTVEDCGTCSNKNSPSDILQSNSFENSTGSKTNELDL